MDRTGAGRAAAGIGLSRISGVARSVLVTNVLGIGAVGDAFAAALRIPNILRNLLGEGALTAAFVPEYTRLADTDKKAAGRLAASVASFLVATIAVLVALGVLAARPITRLVAWGFEGERFELAVQLTRIMIAGTGVLVLGAWCIAVLNTHGWLFTSYVAPVLWNLAQIATLIVLVFVSLSTADQARNLAWAVVVGAMAQVLFSMVAVWRANRAVFARHRVSWREAITKKVLRRLGPAILGRGAFQISAFVDLALASLLAVGATAALAAAQAVYLLPIALLGIAVAASELPALSRLDTAAEMVERTRRRVGFVTYLVTGIVVLYLVAGVPLADTLYNLAGLREGVPIDDITLIAITIGAYSLGLPAIVASRLWQNVLFASGDTASPARISGVRITLAALVGLALMFPLDRLLVLDGSITGLTSFDLTFFSVLDDVVRLDQRLPARLGAVGLALGASMGAWLELALLRRRIRISRDSTALRQIVPAACSLAVGIVSALVAGQLLGTAPAWLRLVAIAVPTGAAHLSVGLALGLEGARQVISAMRITSLSQKGNRT